MSGGKFSLMGSVIGAYTIQALTTTLYAYECSVRSASGIQSNRCYHYRSTSEPGIIKQAMQQVQSEETVEKWLVVQGGEQ